MPIGRYFFVVGSVLLALLFLADWYYSAATATPPDTLSPSGGGIDRSILQIRSDQRWPERIVIDTSQPTIVPPAAVAELPRRAGLPRESFAAMDSGAAAPAPAAMRARPDRLKRQRIARHRQANSFAESPAGKRPGTMADGMVAARMRRVLRLAVPADPPARCGIQLRPISTAIRMRSEWFLAPSFCLSSDVVLATVL